MPLGRGTERLQANVVSYRYKFEILLRGLYAEFALLWPELLKYAEYLTKSTRGD
jgi:hypothetical protein